MSASNRRKGNDFERKIAKYFRDVYGIDIHTARSLSGGTQSGVDLLYPDGSIPEWAIECKDDAGMTLTSMLYQAEQQAPEGHPYCVIQKARGRAIEWSVVTIPCQFWGGCFEDCEHTVQVRLNHFASHWAAGEVRFRVSN